MIVHRVWITMLSAASPWSLVEASWYTTQLVPTLHSRRNFQHVPINESLKHVLFVCVKPVSWGEFHLSSMPFDSPSSQGAQGNMRDESPLTSMDVCFTSVSRSPCWRLYFFTLYLIGERPAMCCEWTTHPSCDMRILFYIHSRMLKKQF